MPPRSCCVCGTSKKRLASWSNWGINPSAFRCNSSAAHVQTVIQMTGAKTSGRCSERRGQFLTLDLWASLRWIRKVLLARPPLSPLETRAMTINCIPKKSCRLAAIWSVLCRTRTAMISIERSALREPLLMVAPICADAQYLFVDSFALWEDLCRVASRRKRARIAQKRVTV